MPVRKSLSGNEFVETIPKKTYQGSGKHTKYAATSSNKPKKRYSCLLYTSPSPRDRTRSRMPSSA